ncbi:MAG TPA: DUF3570 domain-containing protein [Xanthomonadales bacterium]|nr:DUF3570 domain-containing protein [Xanthomonadales bacterium]
MKRKPASNRPLLAAALALPGLALAPLAARAERPPGNGEVSLRYSHYQEWQPGDERIEVVLPALFVLTPIGDDWTLETQLALDSVSGASPLYHDTLSGASGIGVDDVRRSIDVDATKYFERASLALGATVSREDDYDSNAIRAVATFDSDDRNRTITVGAGYSDDTIDSVNGIAEDEQRHTTDVQLGIARVLTARDVAQASVTFAHGRGYFDDPYKVLDRRPGSRDERALSLRWNHAFERTGSALRLAYRVYDDSWGITAHSVDAAWEHAFANGLSLVPSLRYHTQSAADFYFDPPVGTGFVPGADYTADARLSAFGAVTAALKLEVPFGKRWRSDFKLSFYRQKDEWRAFGDGSPDLLPVSARVFEIGLTYAY